MCRNVGCIATIISKKNLRQKEEDMKANMSKITLCDDYACWKGFCLNEVERGLSFVNCYSLYFD